MGIQRVGPLLGRLVGVTDDRLGQEEELTCVWIPPERAHPGLECIVEPLPLLDRLAADEDGFGVAGREFLPALRRPGLENDRAPLRRRRGAAAMMATRGLGS